MVLHRLSAAVFCLGPNLEMNNTHYNVNLFNLLVVTRRVKSQDPVQIAVPSGETFKQDTLFSCP